VCAYNLTQVQRSRFNNAGFTDLDIVSLHDTSFCIVVRWTAVHVQHPGVWNYSSPAVHVLFPLRCKNIRISTDILWRVLHI